MSYVENLLCAADQIHYADETNEQKKNICNNKLHVRKCRRSVFYCFEIKNKHEYEFYVLDVIFSDCSYIIIDKQHLLR